MLCFSLDFARDLKVAARLGMSANITVPEPAYVHDHHHGRPRRHCVRSTRIRLFVWLAIGLTIYFSYGRFHAAAARRNG
ncbi:MAG: hypothetical protein ACRENK_06480 [Gemmatimonadaceae bacterium]